MNWATLQLLNLVGKILVGSIPGVGEVIDLGLQLGAFDWLGKLLVKVLAQRFGLGVDISAKLVKAVGFAIIKTDDEIKSGTLITAEDKQKFASNILKSALKNDPDFKNVKNFDSAGSLLIELVYQLQQLAKNSK
jgi:hypothetical protein